MARLPQPGGDAGNWGEILNEYLTESIAGDGTIKNDTIGSSQLKSGAVTSDKLSTNTAADGQVLSYNSGSLAWISPASAGAISADDISDATSGGALVHSGTSSGAIQIGHADNIDVQVTATLSSYTTGVNTNIELYRKSSGTCYLLGLSATTGTLRLGRSDGVIYQDYGTDPGDVVGKSLRIRYHSGKISAYLDGVLLSEHTDSSVTRSTSGSGFSRGGGTITATWDNFVLESLT